MDWVGRKKGGLLGFQVWHFPQNFKAGSMINFCKRSISVFNSYDPWYSSSSSSSSSSGGEVGGRDGNLSCSLVLSGRSFGLLFIFLDFARCRTNLPLVLSSVRSLGLPMQLMDHQLADSHVRVQHNWHVRLID